MIYLRLFLTFLKIGAFSFGGGYGMISIIREECLSYGWLTEEELLNFIAVAESTPGPIAINMATFVGSAQGGFLGALLATVGVVLPSFIIILLIVVLLKNVLRFAGVQVALKSIRPAVCGLIIATGFMMLLTTVFSINGIDLDWDSITDFSFSRKNMRFGLSLFFRTLRSQWKTLLIFFVLFIVTTCYRKWKKKAFSPILLILLAGCLGVVFYL